MAHFVIYMQIMGYLTEVGAGGNTVFPFVGAFSKPVKHAVVVWWNMDRAGGYDVLSRHAGCPVISGNKWIANKWISMYSQMFKKPCPAYSKQQMGNILVRGQQHQRGDFFREP